MTSTHRSLVAGETVDSTCAHCNGSIYRYADATTWWHRSTYAARCRTRSNSSPRTEAAPADEPTPTTPAPTEPPARVTGGPSGYMVGRRNGRTIGVAERDGINGWQIWHAGEIVADHLTQADAADHLRTLPTPTWSTT